MTMTDNCGYRISRYSSCSIIRVESYITQNCETRYMHCRQVPPNSCKARLRQTSCKTCTLMSTRAVNQHYSLVTANCPSIYLHPNIPVRFIGAKMNIYHFSFSISMLIKRRKGTSWILSNISHTKNRRDIWRIFISDFGSFLFQHKRLRSFSHKL